MRPIRRSVKQLARKSPLWPLLRPRRFHAYCVGPPKSGTVSAWGMFSSGYRSGHETARDEIVEMMILRFAGAPTREAALWRLRRRDRRLRLEMDSFGLLAMFSEELVEAFPRACFLLTVRRPDRWLNSIINQHLNVDVSNRPGDRRLRELLHGEGPGAGYSTGEEELERRGLFPIAGYLRGWSLHYRWVIDAVPPERLLVIRTEDLSTSIDRLARFLSIPPATIDRNRTHLHRSPCDHGVVGRLSPALVEDMVQTHCNEVLARLTALMDSPERSNMGPETTETTEEEKQWPS